MPHYKDSKNKVYFIDDVSFEHVLPKGCVQISDEEARVLVDNIQKQINDSLTYTEKRRGEYPSIGDQLDALFKAGVFPEEMAAKIQAVKDKYPKS